MKSIFSPIFLLVLISCSSGNSSSKKVNPQTTNLSTKGYDQASGNIPPICGNGVEVICLQDNDGNVWFSEKAQGPKCEKISPRNTVSLDLCESEKAPVCSHGPIVCVEVGGKYEWSVMLQNYRCENLSPENQVSEENCR